MKGMSVLCHRAANKYTLLFGYAYIAAFRDLSLNLY